MKTVFYKKASGLSGSRKTAKPTQNPTHLPLVSGLSGFPIGNPTPYAKPYASADEVKSWL